MSLRNHSILAVIPARGGSKSIPRKNLRKVSGLSLVAMAAKVAGELSWLDCKILSTDDEEIAEEGRAHGLRVPFIRPASLSGDSTTSRDMWRHAWLETEKIYGDQFDVSILLEPTSPLRRAKDVTRTVRALFETEAPAAVTVSRTPAHYTPHKTLTIDEAGHIGFYLDKGAYHSLRQSIPEYFHRNGICYAVRRHHLIDEGLILEKNTVAVVIERPIVNIDESFELEFAEWLLVREKALD